MKQLLRYSTPAQSYEYYGQQRAQRAHTASSAAHRRGAHHGGASISADWNNEELTTLLSNSSDYKMLVRSWLEQRVWAIDVPLSALSATHPIRTESERAFRAIAPPPTISRITDGYTAHPLTSALPFSVGPLNLTFSTTGALSSVLHRPSTHQWASAEHALGEVIYQTFDEAHSYDAFLREYISFDMDAPGADQYPRYDFGKRGLDASAAPAVQLVRPTVRNRSLWARVPGAEGYDASFVVEFDYARELWTKYGAPQSSALLVHVNASALSLHFVLINVNKTRTRIPEAGWLSFNPLNPANVTAHVNKIDSWVDLGQPVMGNGSAHLHVVSERGVRLPGSVLGRSPDVGLVCVGYPPTPFPTPLGRIVGNPGAFSFNLFNNIWGTNYPMWYPFIDEDLSQQYRVDLQLLLPTREHSQ